MLGPGTYFRGEDVSLFGGLEYSLPAVWTPLGWVVGLWVAMKSDSMILISIEELDLVRIVKSSIEKAC